jgi:hypothetical protein
MHPRAVISASGPGSLQKEDNLDLTFIFSIRWCI